MDIIEELKKLLLKVGVEEDVVNEQNPYTPLAAHVLDSLGYSEFIVSVEEHFGVKFHDPDSIFIRSLIDIKKIIEEKS
jgi:acyl carrier protein